MTAVKDHLRRRLKSTIIASGLKPSRHFHYFNALLKLGRWRRQNPSAQHLPTREALFDAIQAEVDQPIDYLEFGVFEGKSIAHWAQINPYPESRFFGFDGFTGLPEPWVTGSTTFARHHFSTGGKEPALDDGRVSFIKGLFQETLPAFLEAFRPQNRLVVHFDADLYNSTLYGLCRLHPFLVPGSFLIFDDFSVATHDFQAFYDYAQSHRRAYRVAATAEMGCEILALEMLQG